MHDIVLAGFDFAGIDRHCSAGIDDDHLAALDRLRSELGLLFVKRTAGQIWHPWIREVIGLGFERVGSNRDDGVGQFGILVAIVELADPHIAGGVYFGIV